MSKRAVEAERYFGETLRAPKTFNPKVETSLTRLEQQNSMNRFGLGFMLSFVGVFAVVMFLECLRTV